MHCGPISYCSNNKGGIFIELQCILHIWICIFECIFKQLWWVGDGDNSEVSADVHWSVWWQ